MPGRSRVRATSGVVVAFLLTIVFAIACSSTEPAPAIDPAQLSQLVQDAVKAAVPAAPSVPAPVSAAEIQQLVETAVTAAAAVGTEPPTAAEISAMVEKAVASATTPGVTKEEIRDLVTKAVSESATSGPSPLSTEDVAAVVSKALLAMPMAAPVVVEVFVTPTPGAVQPRGTLVVAVNDVGPASSYRPKEMLWPYNNRALILGIYESALRFEKDFVIGPSLASSWVLTAEGVTLTVRDGVPFHDESTGNVTAEDFVFTFEDGRLDGNKKLGEVINPFYDEITALDSNTVMMNLKSPSMRWVSVLTKLLDGNAPISSKKLFDEIGGDQANLTPNGTGPFRVTEQISDDSIILQAVVPHWRQTAGFARVEILEVPEDAIKIAMLQTGEADIIPVTASQIDQVNAVPRARLIEGRQKFGSSGVNVWLSGQYYATTKKDGSPSGNVPVTERPWVGDPSDPTDMANARKVRMAMSMAVDREAILDTILGGRGCLAYVIGIDSCNPRWNPEWKVPFDPEGAKALLAEAGYPDGFEFPFFIPVGGNPVLEEVGEALPPMWEAIGLTAKIEKAAYQAKRPSMLSKEISDAWVWNHSDYGLPINVISGIGFQTADTVWGPGYTYDFAQGFVDRLGKELDLEKQFDIAMEWEQKMFEWMPSIQIASFVSPWAMGPNVAKWVYPYHTSRWPDELFSAVPAR